MLDNRSDKLHHDGQASWCRLTWHRKKAHVSQMVNYDVTSARYAVTIQLSTEVKITVQVMFVQESEPAAATRGVKRKASGRVPNDTRSRKKRVNKPQDPNKENLPGHANTAQPPCSSHVGIHNHSCTVHVHSQSK